MLIIGIVHLLLIHYAFAETYNTCKVLPVAEGYSITKYYAEKCVHCQSITPKIKKIVNSIERKGINITAYNVDTAKCHDEIAEIEAIPTIILRKDNKELLKFSGDMEYEKIVEMFTEATGLSHSIFEKEVHMPQEILSVTKQDFLSSFVGPWIVYFENAYDQVLEDILLETYKSFHGEIKIARYTGADKEIVAGRYYIYDFPGLLVMYDGILMRYNGDMTLAAFHEFCSRLVEPSFKDITTDELSKISHPTFVVFYSDIVLANRAFRRIAHDLKMNASTFKMKIESEEKESILRLAVFKNGNKFYYDGDINNEGAIREWLFHAHFPNISKLGMDNFYSIFHGLKPVVTIVTEGGNKELENFEEIAYENNRGAASSPYVFTFVDKSEYPKFTETNFGALKSDYLIVFFNPEQQMFYGRRRKAKESVQAYFDTQLNDYKEGKLPKYAKENVVSYKKIVIGCAIVASVGTGLKMLLSSKKKKTVLE
ncbi:hypothetical protein NEMIN01_1617 [Nematocida minor]|uniref:uncharacterized protein n=1 Tax=Nematocida minor TaxID=1912983 RepID=UPI0022207977|nr:uncharacterized protein NEMIN01_1617 [Nematocida minor]KAI5191684.1 hypothetical protein NEMIN01_1617 [Nematocida minor]